MEKFNPPSSLLLFDPSIRTPSPELDPIWTSTDAAETIALLNEEEEEDTLPVTVKISFPCACLICPRIIDFEDQLYYCPKCELFFHFVCAIKHMYGIGSPMCPRCDWIGSSDHGDWTEFVADKIASMKLKEEEENQIRNSIIPQIPHQPINENSN